MEKFARLSDATNKGMNEGYCFNDGEYYCETEEEAKNYVESLGLNWKEERETVDTDEEWFYFTEWYDESELEDEWYDIDGNLCTKTEVLHLIYTLDCGIPDEYVATRNDKTAKKTYIDRAKDLGVEFTLEQEHLSHDEIENIVREQLEWAEKEIRWDSVNLI